MINKKCKKQRTLFIKFIASIALLAIILLFLENLRNKEIEKFNITHKAFIDNKVLKCSRTIVSKQKGWKISKEANHITNGDILFHLNRCSIYGEL